MAGKSVSRERWITYEQCAEKFSGRTVALIGSGPSAMDNVGKEIDSFDLIVRVQNYKMRGYEDKVGSRTDVHYSFYGGSMRKTRAELQEDGVYLCMCKCPDGALPFKSPWHEKNRKPLGTDYRYIYTARAKSGFWFCPTYAPTMERFLQYLAIIKSESTKPPYIGHQPSTGFACMLDLMNFATKSVYVTGFDFFTSGVHNLNEKWEGSVVSGVPHSKNPDDPMCHRPDLELKFMRDYWPRNWKADAVLSRLIGG